MFKRAARLGTFKNIALSLALHHQRLLCYEVSTGRLLDAPMETGPCSDSGIVRMQPEHVQRALRRIVPALSGEVSLHHG